MLGWWLPENVSTYGGGVFHLVYWASAIGLLIAQASLSRFRRGGAAHGHPMLEVVWATVPALILVWLGLLSHRSATGIATHRPQVAFEQTTSAADVSRGTP